MQNFYFRLTCVAQKRLCVNSPVRPIETTGRGFQTIFQLPNRYNSKLTNYSFFSNAPSKPFITIPISGATKSTSIFKEGRLGWTLTRPSYRLIGTHRLTRSVLEWRSVSSSSLLSSTIKPDPCIHWSQMENTELLHWAVTRGRSSLGLGPLYNPTVTRKDSTHCVVVVAERESVSLAITTMIVTAVTPGSGLEMQDTMITPTRVATKLTREIMASSTSKRWDIF